MANEGRPGCCAVCGAEGTTINCGDAFLNSRCYPCLKKEAKAIRHAICNPVRNERLVEALGVQDASL